MSLCGKSRSLYLALALTMAFANAHAAPPIPKESGFSGNVSAGLMAISFESNMVAGFDFGDAGSSKVSSIFDGPESEDDLWPMVNFDLRYTFANSGTQVFLGNRLEDFIRLDFTNQLGIRQAIGERSTISIAAVFTSFPAEVWADPYVAGVSRNKTDRENTGARLDWDNALDSNFGLTYTYRKVELDNEQSGLTQLGLPAAQAALLSREGDIHAVEGSYNWKVGERQSLIPALVLSKRDLDGDAMSNDRVGVQLTWVSQGDDFSYSVNAAYTQADYDKANPIYGRTREDDVYALAGQLFWHRPFGAPEGLSALFTAGLYREDSNIDFYDSKATFGGVSAFYRF